MRRPHLPIVLLLLPVLLAAAAAPPNVVLILADDLGYGDLSIYGQTKLSTPNIDRLGHEGVRFTDHYSGNTVCTPSRACLLTGRHPGHAHVRSNLGRGREDRAALDPDQTTLGRLFKNAGYATGAFGKWGLGTTDRAGVTNPLTHGFDHYTGWTTQTAAHTYYPSALVRDGKRVALEPGTYVHDLIMDDAFGFIRTSVAEDKPFFCYIPTAIPHAAMHAPEDLHRKWRARLPQFDDRVGTYSAGPGETCADVVNPVAGFAAMIEHLDNQVGDLLTMLDELGVDENTLVIFTSDNGPHSAGGHDMRFWDSNGPLRGMKRDFYEGGIRAPLLARWPGRVAPGRVSDHASASWDVLATAADLTGQQLPADTDGISLLPTLVGDPAAQAAHDFLYWEAGVTSVTMQAVRMGSWKGVRPPAPKAKGKKDKTRTSGPGSLELYHLADDPGETRDLAADHPDIADQIRQIMERAHRPL